MNSLEIQEKTIYNYLQPYFFTQGYQVLSPRMEFRKVSETVHKSILYSICQRDGQQVLDIHLGIGFPMIESLVSQFMRESEIPAESYIIKATPYRFKRPPLPRFVLTDEGSLAEACKQIKEFMQKKGFRFLNTFGKLKRVDAVINRKPMVESAYLHNQLYRCFVGITLARLLQRTDFDSLCIDYGNYLYSQRVPEKVILCFDKLATYLKYFSLN